MDNQTQWFFGSKLNTFLLLILIILMIIALRFMYHNKETYLPMPQQLQEVKTVVKTEASKPEIEGNKADLVSFSIKPGQEVEGKVKATGSVKGGYFFEGNILINILDANKKILKASHGTAVGDWMTSKSVSFTADLDFTGLLKGKAYIQIHNDNASGLPENDKSILIPIVIK